MLTEQGEELAEWVDLESSKLGCVSSGEIHRSPLSSKEGSGPYRLKHSSPQWRVQSGVSILWRSSSWLSFLSQLFPTRSCSRRSGPPGAGESSIGAGGSLRSPRPLGTLHRAAWQMATRLSQTDGARGPRRLFCLLDGFNIFHPGTSPRRRPKIAAGAKHD